MTVFDYAVLGIVGLSVLVSLFRGAVREIMALVSWIGGFLIALRFAPMLSALLPASVGHPWLRLCLAFGALMLASLIVFALITVALTRVVRDAKLGAWDRVAGVLFGLVRGLVILVVLVLMAGMTPLPREAAWRNALFSPTLVALAKSARAFLPAALAERIHFE
jgi:membrane protein required for colicin V production